MGFLIFLGVLLAWGYSVYTGRFPGLGIVIGLVLACAGTLAAYDGATRAWREYQFAHDGRVAKGVVLAQLSPDPAGYKRVPRRWRARRDLQDLLVSDSRPHDLLGRWMLNGSPRLLVTEYRYECERFQGCRGRDIVPEALWRQLHPGDRVNVRRSNSDLDASRLEDNPQIARAISDLTIAAALLLAGGVVSGFLTQGRSRYVTVPAVVMALEPVRTGDEPCWRLRFAFFDSNGDAHEASDEVIVDRWKPGDEGFAVFPPNSPDLATFRPVG